jgi:hypothetical protein
MWLMVGFATAYLTNRCGSELCGFKKLSPALRVDIGHTLRVEPGASGRLSGEERV